MMGSHQLIVVKEAQYLDRSIDQLANYCSAPQPQSVLVLCYNTKIRQAEKGVQGNSTKWANLGNQAAL